MPYYIRDQKGAIILTTTHEKRAFTYVLGLRTRGFRRISKGSSGVLSVWDFADIMSVDTFCFLPGAYVGAFMIET